MYLKLSYGLTGYKLQFAPAADYQIGEMYNLRDHNFLTTSMTTSGPRPLRLASSAESPTVVSSSPLTPNSAGPKRNSSFQSNPRRQSSISYNPPARDNPLSPNLLSPRSTVSPILAPNSPNPGSSLQTNLSRSASVGSRVSKSIDFQNGIGHHAIKAGPSTPTTPGWKGNRNSTGSLLTEQKDRPPLTLVEKHAELLHFIAQKESKCLELRTQLTAHEAELLQLKKKWERIVARGFERSLAQSGSTTPLSAFVSDSPSDISTHPPSASIYSAASLSYLDSLSTQAQGAGGAAMLEALGGMKGIRESVQQGVGRFLGAVAGTNETGHRRPLTHAPSSPSTSSSSTFTTTSSTRLSQSSQSSFGESISEEEAEEQAPKKTRRNRPSNIEIVSDTGATPLVSPTRDFAFENSLPTATPLKSVSGSSRSETGANIRSRRKSRTFSDEESAEYVESDTSTSESLSTSLADWGVDAASSTNSPRPDCGNGSGGNNLYGSSLRPKNGTGAGPDGNMSWVGSMVGKRWEDTISKNQKRASILLSDVSQSITQSLKPQSIIQALVSPPLTSSELAPPMRANRLSSTSLLDEDVPLGETGRTLTPLLQPAVLSPTRALSTPSTLEPQPKAPMKGVASPTRSQTVNDDDDEDWNW
ncbi:hypothetical protein D9757_004823 [Collybiopsis confluens]|uniref:Uncharacterized protein n=1 Tax=Collybiopsis confluens TaxID=2823264 RepID=A0A8H5MCD6_9AGAR|nr:hypothetical protein D9757_004823 [Collybiopsis confluens]